MSSSVAANVTPAPLTVCTEYPLQVNSLGMWNRSQSWMVNVSSPLVNFSFPLQNFTVPILEFEMTLMFLLTQLSHFFLKMFGLPVFAAQLLAGVVLGDAGLNRMGSNRTDHFNPIFPYVSQEVLDALSMYGYALFCFLMGVKMDLGLVSKTGKKAIYNGAITLGVPLIAGFTTLTLLASNWSFEWDDVFQLIFVIEMQSLSTSPVIACVLSDLKILNSELGRLALSSALVSDIVMVSLTSFGTWSKVMKSDLTRGILDLVVMIVFTLFVSYVCRPIMVWMVKQTPEGKPVKESYIYIILLGAMCSGLLAYWCDLPFVNGPLILGLAVPDGPPLGATLVKKLDFMTNSVFMPVFVTTAMMRVSISLHKLPAKSAVMAAAILALVVFWGKVLASLVTPLCSKMPTRDAMALALLMCSKGVVEIAAYTYVKDTQFISNDIYNVVMLTIVSSAVLVPPLVNRLYDPKNKYATYQNRNLVHSTPDSELRILACINRSDDIPAIINLLDASCPTRESPIGLYVLHLIELVGRTAPIFISHNVQNKSLSNYKNSENVILSFSDYKKDNEGAISLQVFTALSPPRYMYDDVCTLAIDKVTSLIILPFHRKWSTTGSVESENKNIRHLNCSVLETAPCSVGILVNRGHINSLVSPKEPYRVAIIFLGGSDDREALSFVERMVKDTSISLTVIHLVDVSGDEKGYDSWQWVQDNEMLKELKRNRSGYVSYVEENIEDGTKTADKIRSLMDEDEYDLFIVGRRYKVRSPMTTGLEEWSEFPELGVIGDMLSSVDCSCHSSVLIIQQQQQRRNNIKPIVQQ